MVSENLAGQSKETVTVVAVQEQLVHILYLSDLIASLLKLSGKEHYPTSTLY